MDKIVIATLIATACGASQAAANIDPTPVETPRPGLTAVKQDTLSAEAEGQSPCGMSLAAVLHSAIDPDRATLGTVGLQPSSDACILEARAD